MSERKEITKMLSLAIQKHINPDNDNRVYWAKEVTFNYMAENMCRVDFMQFKPVNNTTSGIEKGNFYCYEVKSSVEDFHSKNGHNFIGDFNYYVMPKEVYEKVKDEIPYRVGVYVPDGKNYSGEYYLTNIKKAKRQDRVKPVAEMLLMMFRSATRDFQRQQLNGWIPCSEELPDKGSTVLVYMKNKYNDSRWRAYKVCEYANHFVGMGNLCEAIAWQPLEPYREGKA